MLIYLFIFIFGAIVGSFLNVVILRYNTGQSIAKGRSQCLNCGKELRWHELVPVISFIIQKGKCRGCNSKISFQYPLVELLTGLIFVAVWNHELGITNYGFLNSPDSLFFILNSIYFWIVLSILIIIAVYDLRHQIIPNGFVYSFIILSFLNLGFVSDFGFRISDFLAGVAFFGFFALLWWFSRGRAMGFGDAKLALGIGWFLGFSKGILALLLSFWSGALVGIFLLLLLKKRYNMKSKIPFGPFLVLGAIISFLAGDIIINSYIGLYI